MSEEKSPKIKVSIDKFKMGFELEEPYKKTLDERDLEAIATTYAEVLTYLMQRISPPPTSGAVAVPAPESPLTLSREDLVFFAKKCPLEDLERVIDDLEAIRKERESEQGEEEGSSEDTVH